MFKFTEPSESVFFRRLATGLGANLLGKLWVVAIQLVSIPVLSRSWGATGLGTWLMLSAVPTYLAMSATGFSAAAATDMTHAAVKRDWDRANETFQTVWLLTTAITGTIAALYVLSSGLLFALRSTFANAHAEQIFSIALIIAYSVITLQNSLIASTYRASSRYALGTTFLDLISLAEGLGVILSAISGGHFCAAISSMILVRSLGAASMYAWIKAKEPWFELGWRRATRAALNRLLHPSIGALSLTLSNALALQGVVVLLGLTVSPAVAAAYSTARTVCRTPLQISDLLSRAALPELTLSIAQGNQSRFRMLTTANIFVAGLVAIPSGILISLFAPQIMSHVTASKIHFEPYLFVALSAAAGAQCFWLALSQSLMALNRQHLYGYTYLVLSVGLCLSACFAHVLEGPATFVAIVSAACEMFTLVRVATKISSQ